MVVYCVDVRVVPGTEDEFKKATIANHKATRREKGNFRFDVLQDDADPSHFFLYEAYRSPEAAAAHKETGHYKKWRDLVAPMMAGERRGIRYESVVPAEDGAW